MLDIIPAMKCVVSLAIGLALGYASAKMARIIGKVSSHLLLLEPIKVMILSPTFYLHI